MSTPICKCKHVLQETIEKAVKNGASSVEEVRRTTGATDGACKGARCKGLVEHLIKENQ